ncbi:MAG: hypothetical protein Tsb0017_09760 [Geothermobacteraceae bacterium]
MTGTGNERGLALVLVLVIVALLAALVSDFAFSTLIETRLAGTFRDSRAAASLARGGITVGRELLRQDSNGYDAQFSGEEFWRQPMEGVPVADGSVSLRITDLDGRLGLNALVDAVGNPNVVMVERFVRLAERLELDDPQGLADALVDWLDPDNEPRASGAEAQDYLAAGSRYTPGNAPIVSPDELIRVRGFSAEVMDKLAPFVAAHAGGKLNVNSAARDLLLAWDEQVEEADVELLLEERTRRPFRNLDQVRELIGVEAFSALNRNLDLTVESRYFHLDSQAQVGDGTRRIEVAYDRKADRILWQKVD